MVFDAFLHKRPARFSPGSWLAIAISSALHIGSAAALGFWGGGAGEGEGAGANLIPTIPISALRSDDDGVPVRLWDTPIRRPSRGSAEPPSEEQTTAREDDTVAAASRPRRAKPQEALGRRTGAHGPATDGDSRLEMPEPAPIPSPEPPEPDLNLTRGPEVPVVPPPIEVPPPAMAAAPEEPAYVPEGEALGLRVYERFPRLPLELAERGAEYLVSARICVSASGQVQDVDLLKPSHSMLDRALLEAMGTWRYLPWTPQGQQATAFCHPIHVRYVVR